MTQDVGSLRQDAGRHLSGTDGLDLSPSARLVLWTMQGQGPMTGADLRSLSGLPRRTIYAALRTLRENGVVLERQSLRDTRQKFFWLASAARPSTSGHPMATTLRPAPTPGR